MVVAEIEEPETDCVLATLDLQQLLDERGVDLCAEHPAETDLADAPGAMAAAAGASGVPGSAGMPSTLLCHRQVAEAPLLPAPLVPILMVHRVSVISANSNEWQLRVGDTAACWQALRVAVKYMGTKPLLTAGAFSLSAANLDRWMFCRCAPLYVLSSSICC